MPPTEAGTRRFAQLKEAKMQYNEAGHPMDTGIDKAAPAGDFVTNN